MSDPFQVVTFRPGSKPLSPSRPSRAAAEGMSPPIEKMDSSLNQLVNVRPGSRGAGEPGRGAGNASRRANLQ